LAGDTRIGTRLPALDNTGGSVLHGERLTFRQRTPKSAGLTRDAVEGSGWMRKAVLIVDDSKFARLTLRSAVMAALPGCLVSEAANGAEAFASLNEVEADFVLIDYNMPGEDGLTVAMRLRESHPAMKLVLVTANVQDAVAQKARAAGIAFIAKPIDTGAVAAFLNGA
jgi:two-component system, chemotaxis family, chemotaxis protein CheY